MAEKRTLFKVYVVDPRGSGKILLEGKPVISETEDKALLKAGVAQVAADSQLELEQVKELLKEEFQDADIEKVHYAIVRHLAEAKERHEFQERVLELYNSLGMNILDAKTEVMRALSSRFKKEEMGKVYATIWNHTVQ